MIKILALLLLTLPAIGQMKMRPVEDLVNKLDPGWPYVQQWISNAKNAVEVLPVDSLKAIDALYKSQVTTRSTMGAIVYMTGGILVDKGWIRILGSGSEKLNRSLPEWNKGKVYQEFGQPSSYLLIADDILGGFFMLNAGGLGEDIGNVYYLAPDNLMYEPLGLTYTEFLQFCFNNNLDEFYKGYRWKNWENDIVNLSGNQVYNFFPYLWTKEGKDINNVSKKEIPIAEQYDLNMSFIQKLTKDTSHSTEDVQL